MFLRYIKDRVPGYEILIADGPNSALDDLKTISPTVRKRLLGVIGTDLRPSPPASAYEGGLPSGWHWRRGLTRQQQARLHRFPQTAEPEGEQPSDYVIVYRPFTAAERHQHGRGFYVYRVFSNEELAGAALDLLVPRRPLAPQERGRLAG